MEDIIAPVFVELSDAKIERVKRLCEERYEHVRRLGYANKHGLTGDGRQEAEDGMFGEIAFCQGMRLPWVKNFHTFQAADILGYIEVKTSPSKHTRPSVTFGNMIIRPHANPSYCYALVVGKPPHYIIQGWGFGSELMHKKWLARPDPNRPPAYLIPNLFLNKNMSDLLRLREQRLHA